MRVMFYLFLMLNVGRCSDEQTFETKTVYVGENINLTCPRRDVGTLFWIKLVSGDFPKILGRSFSSQSADQRIRTVTDPGIFDLYITKAQQSDTGVYICMKTANRELTFLNGTYLKVEGPEPPFTTAPPPDSVHQEHTVNLQCLVLHDFQNKTCPVDDNVFCLSAEPHQSNPGSNYTHVNGGDEYERNSEALSTKTCFYSYFRNFSSSDSQTYYCAVATCVESFSRNKTTGDAEVKKSCSKKDNTILYLLCVALAISLIVIACLVYSIKKLKKSSYVYSNDAVALQTNVISSGDQENQQTDEDLLFYSAPTFKKASKSGTKDTKPAEEESIYTDVKALELD
uniref:Immunoglobulin domain-containing protein n=1 Tax=Astatotilapia calliptera TaxID=8154 RepID=A0AAX7SD14_ASTCA